MTGHAASLPNAERPALKGWVLAAVVVALGHALLAWMLLTRPPADDIPRGSELAAVLIDLAPAPEAPATAPPEQPTPAAPPAETKSEMPPVEQPPEPALQTPPPAPQPDPVAPTVEVPAAPKPEVVLAQPSKPVPRAPQTKKPPQATPKKPVVKREAQASAQRLASAPSAAPPAGVAVSATDVASWRAALVAQINRNMRYPEAARTRGETGTAMVSFTLDRHGNVIATRLAGRTGSPDLDQEALAIVRRASPLPAPPAGLGGGAISLSVPLRFSVR